jgi:hypothetical protein
MVLAKGEGGFELAAMIVARLCGNFRFDCDSPSVEMNELLGRYQKGQILEENPPTLVRDNPIPVPSWVREVASTRWNLSQIF